MPYPLSSDVTPGEPTLAAQYNNLRADALYFGGNPAGAADLRSLFADYLEGIRLTGSETTLTLEASSAEPCALVLDGLPAVVRTPLTTEISPAAFPSPCLLWIFIRSDGAEPAAFSLNVSESPFETTGTRRIGRLEWTGSKILPHSVMNLRTVQTIQNLPRPEVCQGRLTLTSGQPFPTADISQQETLYFTPCLGSRISLYSLVSGWNTVAFGQLSTALDGYLPEYCYDAFVGLNSGGNPALSLIEWANLNARAEELVYQDGIPVLASAKKWRYVGTIGLTDEGKTRDTLSERNIWNLYNRWKRPLRKTSNVSNQQNPVQNAWVPYAGDSELFVTAVIGLDFADLTLHGKGSTNPLTSNGSALGIGIDTNTQSFSANTNAADLSAFSFSPGELSTFLENRGGGRMLGKHRYHLISYTRNDSHFFNGTLYPESAVGLSGHVNG